MTRIILLSLAVIFLQNSMAGHEPVPFTEQTLVKGKVVDAQTGRPVSSAHVFVVEGEEEGFTAKDGTFRFETWSKTPFYVQVKAKDYETVRLHVKKTGEVGEIKLLKRK